MGNPSQLGLQRLSPKTKKKRREREENEERKEEGRNRINQQAMAKALSRPLIFIDGGGGMPKY